MLTPKQAVRSGYWQYFNGAGRATRAEFLWFFLYLVVLLASPLFIAGVIAEAMALTAKAAEDVYAFANGVSLVLIATHLCPFLTVLARRYRDAGVARWWLLLFLFWVFPGLLLSLVVAFMPSLPIQRSYDGVERVA